jgi:methionyl-tRNA formyltransferase
LAAKPSIAVCALTGFGNAVLRALAKAGHTPRFVVTRPEGGFYPYYDETDLTADANKLGIDCHFDRDGEARIVADKPDLVLVATYHRILGPRIRQAPRRIVNLHPSLLPRDRGPNPFFWVLRNGEKRTGLTAHQLTGDVDAGEIYWQRAFDIAPGETQGSLRRRLAALAGKAAVDVVKRFATGKLAGKAQDESKATAKGRPTDLDRTISADQTVEEALRIARATAPYPGALIGGRSVRDVERTTRGASDNVLRLRDGAIRFAAAKEAP